MGNQTTPKRNLYIPVGLSVSIGLNVLLILLIMLAYQFANMIPLVANSPSQFSILIVPFSLGAVAAAPISFIPYFSLSTWSRILPIVGVFIAGYATSLFFLFDDFRVKPNALIKAYMDRLDQIGMAILAFAVITLLCSTLKIRETSNLMHHSGQLTPEDQRGYWILKALVCDLPIVLSAGVIVLLQGGLLNVAHQNFTEVYFAILNSIGIRNIARPDTFVVGAVNRDLVNANFWIGVTLGVTGVQLVMQQMASLTLEIVFWFRQGFL